ncbi:MAG: DegV family protein [Oscillospiraceae bacterium]
MGAVKIVTNAICDLTLEEAAALGVTMISEYVIFDNVSYLSNRDFDAEEFYKKMRASTQLPTGSQPNINMYMTAFQQQHSCDDIICLNLTSKMSGSFSTANIAASMLMEDGFPARIHIFDSLQASHGLGLLVRAAAKMAAAGEDADHILARLTELRSKVGVYFVMKSLANAKKGGRIGAIKTVLADALNVKPVLVFRDGTVSDVAVVRSFDQAVASLIPCYEKQAEFGHRVIVFHANNLEGAQTLQALVQKADPAANVEIAWLGSAIGIYTGEGAVGLAFWEN